MRCFALPSLPYCVALRQVGLRYARYRFVSPRLAPPAMLIYSKHHPLSLLSDLQNSDSVQTETNL